MSRAITFSTFLLIPASTLLLLCCLSVPVTRLVSLGSLSDLRFGIFGYCFMKGVCSSIQLGYSLDAAISLKPKYTSDFYFSFYKISKLSNILILHIVAAMLTMVTLFFSLIAHVEGPSKSRFFLVVILVVSFFAIISSLLSFVIDILFFIPHLDWGSWGVLAALILNTLVFGLIHLARKHLIVSQTEEIKTAFSCHSQRYPKPSVYKNFHPPRHPGVYVKSERERIDKDKSKLDPVKHPNNDTATYTSNLKKLELPPINIHFDDHYKMPSMNFLDPTYCNLESHSDSHFAGQCSNISNKDKHKDNNGPCNSHLKQDNVSCEKTASSNDHLKENLKYHYKDPKKHREHIRDPREYSRDPREYVRDPRSHSRYYSADMPRDPSRDLLKNRPRNHLRYHSTDIPRHYLRERSVDVSKEPLRDPRDPSKEFSGEYLRERLRERPRECPKQHSRDFLRVCPREFQKEHLREHVNGHSKEHSREHVNGHLREHSREHLREYSVSQTRSRQGLNHRAVQYPPSKFHVGHGIRSEADSKLPYDSVEKGKSCDNFNNLYDEYVPPRQSWKNYPLSQNGYAFSDESIEGQPNSFPNCKVYVSDKPCENNFAVHSYVSQNHAYASRPCHQNANCRSSDNVERLQSSDDHHSRIHQNYQGNNCLRRQESPSRLRSPAESTSSHFTSISQRGINPNWVPPVKEQLSRTTNPKQNVTDTTLANNSNYEVPRNSHKSMGVVGSIGTCKVFPNYLSSIK
ncbi:hypothetical protein PMAC_000603 [Pneumocystis sp. 'macacae']|nr:hypothetical protein PMAC_000603 [Pneumocystis sp. 'macacae']